MRSSLFLLVLVALLTGCQAKPATHAAAGAPNVIAALTDQTVVWSCPQCGMDFDGPGKCSMDDAMLVKMSVAYVCPVDEQAVKAAGKCPRCAANAKVVKAVVADAAPGATPGSAPTGSGTPSGS